MPNTPMQINRKEFQELLKEMQQYNKLDLIAQSIQTKYAKEMAGEDHEQRLKAQQQTNELLEKLLLAVSGASTKGQAIAENANKKSKSSNRSLSLQDDFKLFKEELKSGVSFVKKIVDAFKSPLETVKKGAIGAAKVNEQLYQQLSDVVGTPADFVPESKIQKSKSKNVVSAPKEQRNLSTKNNIPTSTKEKIEAQGKAENPNIVDEPSEVIAVESKKQSVTFGELLDVTKESLTELKLIRSSLEGGPEPLKKGEPSRAFVSSPVSEAASGGSGLLDMFGVPIDRSGKTPDKSPRKKDTPQKKGIGSRIMGGAKAVGSGLLGAARVLGPVAAVAGAAYGGYQGFSRAGEVFGVEQQEATMGQKISSAVGGITDPFGFGYGDKIARGVYGAGEKVGSFFGGIKESVTSKISSIKDSYTKNTSSKNQSSELISKEINKRIREQGINVSTKEGSEKAKLIRAEVIKEFSSKETTVPSPTSYSPEEMITPLSTGSSNLSSVVGAASAMVVPANNVRDSVSSQLQNMRLTETVTPLPKAPNNIGMVIDNTSKENLLMRDEVVSRTGSQPVVMNNVNTMATTTFVPLKGEPRATHRGSALDRYHDRVAAY